MGIEITNCEVEGIGTSWQHIDGLRDLQLKEPSSSVHQHETLRAKFSSLNRTINKCDLHIRFPDSVKVTVQDRDPGQMTHDMQDNDVNENGNEEEIEVATPAVMPTPSTPFGNPATSALNGKLHYKPITVKIWFRCVNPIFGLRFADCDDSALYPHAYTVNHPIPCSTSMWLPCLDGIWERTTWEISVSVPKTLGDIAKQKTNGCGPNDAAPTSALTRPFEDDDISDFRDAIEMRVICSADLVDEKTDISDPSRKIVSFAQGSPVGASHIGFVAGPFQMFNLTDFREAEEDDLMGSSAVDVYGFCLPEQLEDLKNTCFPLYKAMDFFVRDYGSFPFTNYQVCFVKSLEVDCTNLAGLSIVTDRLLFNDRMIDPVYPVTKELVFQLASQWIGVNIIPRSWSDTWLIIGLAYYITGLFLRKLMGNNDYRFRLKQDVVKITELDLGKAPISSRDLEIPIDPDHTRFIALKAPVVLHMLDQRLTKSGSNLGLGRVIPKVFLQALSGDLVNGILSTEKFLRQCEKVSHTKLEDFSRQWIFGHGYPKFSIVQRFNKKKMVIEMGIRQQQFQETPRPPMDATTFVDDAYRAMSKPPIGPVEAIFVGPITIRIHEADGTPYEHIIDLKDQYHKFDIPYNNKYRRRVRTRKQVKGKLDGEIATNGPEENDDEGPDQDHINCLGDGFQSEKDLSSWRLEDWSKEDEDKMSGEAFEWLRIDAGFEWICTMQVGQPDYMFHSQLQQDRDVVAQYEALQYFSSMNPSPVLATILFRTVMDERYYHGIRQLAAGLLSQCAVPDLDMLGQAHLTGIFRKSYCFEQSTSAIPRMNDFSDITAYFLRSSLLKAMRAIRIRGISPHPVRQLFIEQLRHNDNSINFYDDTEYICLLIQCLTSTFVPDGTQHISDLQHDPEVKTDLEDALVELERCQRMDRWRPSYQNLITQAAIEGKERLMQARVLPLSFKELLDYTREVHYYGVRQQAFSSMLRLGALRKAPLARYILYVLHNEPSTYLVYKLSLLTKHGISSVALRGLHANIGLHSDADAMIIEEDTSAAMEARKDRESRLTIDGALGALREEFQDDESLKESLWAVANDWQIAPLARRNLLDICKIMYETKESRVLKFKLPSMKARLVCHHNGRGKVTIKKERPLEKFQKKAPTKPVKIKLKLMGAGMK